MEPVKKPDPQKEIQPPEVVRASFGGSIGISGGDWRLTELNADFVRHFSSGDYRGALKAAEAAFETAQGMEVSPLERAAIRGNLGIACAKTGDLDRAERFMIESLTDLKARPELGKLVFAQLSNLSNVYREMGRDDLADKLLRSSVESIPPALYMHSPESIGRSPLTNLWTSLARRHRFEEALEVLDKGLPIYELALRNRPVELALIKAECGNMRIMLGEPEQAIAPLERAIQLVERRLGRSNEQAIGALSLAACAYALSGDRANAEAALAWARTIERHVPSEESLTYKNVLAVAGRYVALDRDDELEMLYEVMERSYYDESYTPPARPEIAYRNPLPPQGEAEQQGGNALTRFLRGIWKGRE